MFKFKKWHLKSDVTCSLIFLTSVSLPKQLILGALIITPCKKRSQSIFAASWLVLLTFLSSNSCSRYLFYDCPKHSFNGVTKKTAQKCFRNRNIFLALFASYFDSSSYQNIFASPPNVCMSRLHFWCPRSSIQNFAGRLKRRAVHL